MRIIFMGTPLFALTALQALHADGHDIAAVYNQPPRPAGRGRKLTPSPVQAWAETHGLSVHTPVSLKAADAQQTFALHDADVAVVAAYGLLLPEAVLHAPRYGCLNIHASLLPRWRGAAPIQRAILAGDTETGITLMQMDRGLDTGGMLAIERTPITSQTTGGMLHDTLAAMGAQLTARVLRNAPPLPRATRQPVEGVTYAHKLTKDDAFLDFTRPAQELERVVRAFAPRPGAWCWCPFAATPRRLKVLSAAVLPAATHTSKNDATVLCGEDTLLLQTVQPENGKPMAGTDYRRGIT